MKVSETEKEAGWEGETKQVPAKGVFTFIPLRLRRDLVLCEMYLQAAAAEGIVKQMEAKTYSCSECGLKTPSRMTYIQVPNNPFQHTYHI